MVIACLFEIVVFAIWNIAFANVRTGSINKVRQITVWYKSLCFMLHGVVIACLFEILVNEMVYITFTNVEARVNQKVVWGKLSFI